MHLKVCYAPIRIALTFLLGLWFKMKVNNFNNIVSWRIFVLREDDFFKSGGKNIPVKYSHSRLFLMFHFYNGFLHNQA